MFPSLFATDTDEAGRNLYINAYAAAFPNDVGILVVSLHVWMDGATIWLQRLHASFSISRLYA